MIMRIIKVLVALPMILLFGTLRFAVNIISKIYCRAASLVFVPMIILLILSVIETQWLAVGIVGILKCGNIGVETEVQDIQFNIPELFVE